MNVSGIDTNQTQVAAATASSATANAQPVDADGDNDGTSSSQVSPWAQLLSRLQQLQQTDPSKLSSVLTDISNKLTTDAQATGGVEGQALSNLASKFQQAAQTGDLSSLQPTQHRHGGHHHHHAGAYQQAGSSTDPTQTGSAGSTGTQPTGFTSIVDTIEQVIDQDLNGTTGTPSAT